MKIKVLRDYSGEEGTDLDKNVEAGSEHIVSRARGNALHANGLVEILEDEADDADGTEAAVDPAGPGDATEVGVESGPDGADAIDHEGNGAMKTEPENKQQQAPANKQAPAPKTKATGADQAQG